MRMVIILFAIVALLGLTWLLLTQAGIIPEIDIPTNVLDKESINEWFTKKIQELTELIGYESGSIHSG